MKNKYKFMNVISERKWDGFSVEQKRKVFLGFFFEIEEMIQTSPLLIGGGRGRFLEDTILTNFELLKDEDDKCLRSLYDGFRRLEIATTYEMLYDILREVFNEEIIGQKDFHFLPDINIVKRDKEKDTVRLPIILILDNLRSAFNVGSIIRTAECLNVEAVWCCGYTPLPDNPKVVNTAMGTQDRITWRCFARTKEAVKLAQAEGYVVYALETVEGAVSVFENDFNGKTAIVLGNEALGISEDVIKICDKCIVLPLSGWKNSLNVATACAVVCFEVFRQGKGESIMKLQDSYR